MIATMVIRAERMRALCDRGFLAATELADYLTGKGIPFRTAHGVVKRIVAYCETQRIRLDEPTEELRRFDARFDAGAQQVLSVDQVVHVKDLPTAERRRRVREQISPSKETAEMNWRYPSIVLGGTSRYGLLRVLSPFPIALSRWMRAKRLALNNSEALLSSREDVEIALQRVRETESLFFPRLDLNANWSKFRVDGPTPMELEPVLGPTLIPSSPRQNFLFRAGQHLSASV